MQSLTPPLFSRSASTALKGVAIVFVILGHRHVIVNGGAIGVQLFLVLSGYGLWKSVASRGLDGYWRRRAVGVLVPYLLFTIVQLVVQATLLGGFTPLQGIVSIVGLDFGLNIDPCMWYISFAFYWYAWLWVGMKLFGRSRMAALSFLALGVVAVIAFGLFGLVWRPGAAAQVYFLSFPIGVLLARYESRMQVLKGRKALVPLALAAGCAAVLVYSAPSNGAIVNQSVSNLVQSFTWAVLVTVVVVLLADLLKSSKAMGIMEYVGDRSYAMYLNEGLFMRLDPVLGWTASPVATLLGSFAVAVVFDKFVSDPAVKWVKGRLL